MAKMAYLFWIFSPLCSLSAAFLAFGGLGFGAAILAVLGAMTTLLLALSLRRGATQARKAALEEARRTEADLAQLRASLAAVRGACADLAARLPETGALGGLRSSVEAAGAGSLPPPDLEASLAVLGTGAEAEEAARAYEEARLILPLARKVVAAVPAKTEEATMALIERFEEARALSAKAALASKEAMAHLDGVQGSESFRSSANRAKEAIIAERAAVADIVGNSRDNAKKLQAMSVELQSGIELINGIEEITERSRLIAFNMAVEAARIGEKGRGFRVIVNELRSLNDRTVEFSRRVAELLGRYKDYSATLVAGMAEHSERLAGEVMEVTDASQGAVEALLDSATTTEDLSSKLAGLVVELDRNLDGVLEALQFQDITRQMLEGGIHLVEDAEVRLGRATALLGPLGPRDEGASRRRFADLTRGFVARATTLDEKKALQEAHP